MSSAQELVVESTDDLLDTSAGLHDALRLLYANKGGLFGAIVTLFVLIVGIVGAVLLAVPSLHHLYLDQNLSDALFAPGVGGHVAGTDEYGRDLLWRTIAGTGISLLVAVITTAFTLVLGLALGSIAGYFGGKPDTVIGAAVDLTWGFPLLLVAVVFAGMLGPGLTAGDPGDRRRHLGWLRARRAGSGAVDARARVRRGGASARHAGAPDHHQAHAARTSLGTVLVMASYYVAVSVIAEAASRSSAWARSRRRRASAR